MPTVFYVIGYFIPAITRGIILSGAGLTHLWVDALALFAMGSLLFFVAARRFQSKVIMA